MVDDGEPMDPFWIHDTKENKSPAKPFPLKLHVLHLNQDDPKKCTARKLKKFGLVRIHGSLKTIPIQSIKLNPFSDTILSLSDRDTILLHGLTVIDCSWNEATRVFKNIHLKNERRLGVDFLAANAINYAMPGKLSSVEALAAGLIITGFHDQSNYLLSKFTWGHTFLELNNRVIDEFKSKFQDEKREKNGE